MNYIGIRGHRGAGKTSIAYLLGKSIDYILDKQSKNPVVMCDEDFTHHFHSWVKMIKQDENVIYEDMGFHSIYIESFGDGPKTIVSLLLGCDSDLVYQDWYKDHVVINLRNFTYEVYEGEIPVHCLSAEELFQHFSQKKEPSVILHDKYVTLREFIMYFGREIMQRFFGLNVWVKSLKASNSRFPEPYNDKNYYKIFPDAKYPSEITYIKDNGGVVVKVNRPSNKKKGKDMLKHDERYDYEINIDKRELEDLNMLIFDIAMDIIIKNHNKYGKENN